ncbi:MAG TPA: [protein-PII] uridylyltransferase [Labilithrix sp.]
MARATGQVQSGPKPGGDPLAEAVRKHWDELAEKLAAGEDGLALGRARAAFLDRLLADLFAQALQKTGFREPLAMAAVGTFGRGAVALRSDVDIRLVTRPGGKSHEGAARVADALLYPLWDAGLSVGHQVVDVPELLDLAQTDLATATSLLDLRLVAGEASLVEEASERAFAGLFSEGELARFVARLDEEATLRHERFGGSVYLLEPEVKAGAGGLRDLDIARWAARARYRLVETWTDLVRVGVLVPREAHEIGRAEELVWRVRNRLHAHANRKSDRLTFDQQEAIALELGYGPDKAATSEPSPEERAAAAERFMQDYFGMARVISRAREALLLRATPPKRRGKPVEVDLGGGVRLFDGQVTVDTSELVRDPALALRAYATCVKKKAPLLAYARDQIARATADAEWCERLRASAEAARVFVSLLCTVPDVVPVRRGSLLGELHEVGLLLAMIPEFKPVTGRVHHDVYHVYTVDVHSVAAVDCLRAIFRGDLAHERPLAARLAAEASRPEVLFLATLLHDIGKGYPDASGSRKNHSVTGAELCDAILPRLGVGDDDRAEIKALVALHLLMYHVATRRDLDDPATTKDFCAQVRGREGLRDLYLLTVSDITTTSPTAMTTWKARMLDELYFAADACFAGGAADAVGEERKERVKQASLAVAPAREKSELQAFLGSMPERYLLANAPEAIVAHARVASERARGKKPVVAALVPSRHPEVGEICVVADDAPGLLARIAAAITSSRLEVLGAQVYSRETRGRREVPPPGAPAMEAVDLFWVRDARTGAEGVAGAMPRLERDLEAVVTGKSAEDLLRERIGGGSPWRERPSPAVPSEVVVDDRASPRHTVIEVFAKDRPGLLYSLAHALHGLGLSIALSKINTEGTKVADVFYVNELDGSKVAPGARFKAIRETLLEAIPIKTEGT